MDWIRIMDWITSLALLAPIGYLLIFIIRDRRKSKRIKFYDSTISKLNAEGKSLEAFKLLEQWRREIEKSNKI